MKLTVFCLDLSKAGQAIFIGYVLKVTMKK